MTTDDTRPATADRETDSRTFLEQPTGVHPPLVGPFLATLRSVWTSIWLRIGSDLDPPRAAAPRPTRGNLPLVGCLHYGRLGSPIDAHRTLTCTLPCVRTEKPVIKLVRNVGNRPPWRERPFARTGQWSADVRTVARHGELAVYPRFMGMCGCSRLPEGYRHPADHPLSRRTSIHRPSIRASPSINNTSSLDIITAPARSVQTVPPVHGPRRDSHRPDCPCFRYRLWPNDEKRPEVLRRR